MAKKRTTRKVRSTKNIDPLSAMALMQGTGADTALFGKRGFRELSHTPGKRNPTRVDPKYKEELINLFHLARTVKHSRAEQMGWATTEFMKLHPEYTSWKGVYLSVEQFLAHRNPEDIDFLNALAPVPSLGHISFTPDGIERYYRDGFTYQAFSSTPVFADGYRMGAVEGAADVRESVNPKTSNPDDYWTVLRVERYDSSASRHFGIQNFPDGQLEKAKKLAKSEAKFWRQQTRIMQGNMERAQFSSEGKERAVGRRNPASEADQLYEDFHGTPPTETLEYHETLHFHAHLGGLADLCHVVVKIIGGSKNGKELQLNAPDPERADDADVVKLTANEARNQLYFTGGDQSLDLKSLGFRESFDVVHDSETFESTEIKDNMVIGYIYRLMYRTEKKFDNFETIDYHHEAGEDTGCLPFLTYDTLNNKMGVAGGSYVIHEKGIVN